MDTDDSSIPFISPSELRALQGRPGAPLLLDVRRPARFAMSDRLLAGARYCLPDAVEQLAATETARDVVTYCVYGHDASVRAASTLRRAGWHAHCLAGGIEGGEPGVDAAEDLSRWRAERPVSLRKRPEFGITGEQPSRWITRERPLIDRIACPWLIRRFIDPRAEFFYVPATQVFGEGKRLGAVPYDIPGAPISHEWERCSFDALLGAFELKERALDTLATIVRGADTDRLSLAPQAAGLLAISLGLSRLHADDDAARLEAALPVYDALYAWCADGQHETHTWRAHPTGAPA